MRISTSAFAFADALIALEELGHKDVADRLRERWPDVPEPERSAQLTVLPGREFEDIFGGEMRDSIR